MAFWVGKGSEFSGCFSLLLHFAPGGVVVEFSGAGGIAEVVSNDEGGVESSEVADDDGIEVESGLGFEGECLAFQCFLFVAVFARGAEEKVASAVHRIVLPLKRFRVFIRAMSWMLAASQLPRRGRFGESKVNRRLLCLLYPLVPPFIGGNAL